MASDDDWRLLMIRETKIPPVGSKAPPLPRTLFYFSRIRPVSLFLFILFYFFLLAVRMVTEY